MFNPKDIELLETEEGKKKLNPLFVAEFENGKGDDEEDEEVENKDNKETGGKK